MSFRPGDYKVICDVSGQEAYRSECVKQWDGAIVKKEFAERRHPLDTPRLPRPERAPPETRPINDVYLEYGDVTPEDL